MGSVSLIDLRLDPNERLLAYAVEGEAGGKERSRGANAEEAGWEGKRAGGGGRRSGPGGFNLLEEGWGPLRKDERGRSISPGREIDALYTRPSHRP